MAQNKQDFIGGAIAGAMADKVVGTVVERVMKAAAPNSNSGAVVASIENEVKKEMAKVVVNQTNQEPWYQSRVTLGAIATVLTSALALFGVSADIISADELTALLLTGGSLVSGLFTLYGRWVAKKPLGE